MTNRPFNASTNLFLSACRVAVFAIIPLTWPGAFIALKVRHSIITALFHTLLSGIGKGAERSSQVQRMRSPEASPLAGGVWGGSRCPTKKAETLAGFNLGAYQLKRRRSPVRWPGLR